MHGLILADVNSAQQWMQSIQSQMEVRLSQAQNAPQSFNWENIRSRAEGPEFERHGNVAVISAAGLLTHRYSVWSWLTDSSSYRGIIAKLHAAQMDSGIEKVILRVDSFGGEHLGCPEAANKVYECRQAKEVVAAVDLTAASAGYFLASQATRIIGTESAWVGSLGSQMILQSFARYHQQLGIDMEVVRASISPNKNLGHPAEEISDEAREDRQRITDAAGASFLAAVARGRGISEQKVLDNFGQGKMYFTPEAKRLGMVDDVASWEAELQTSAGGQSTASRAKRAVRNSLMATTGLQSG